MKNNEQKKNLLIINGKEIQKIYADDDVWIPIKPLCEVLNIDYKQQLKNIKQDDKLAQLSCNRTTVGTDFRQREMVCLPISHIIHWVYCIQSKSPEFLRFRSEIYDAIVEFSFGTYKRVGLAQKENILLKQEAERAKAAMYQTKEGMEYLAIMDRVRISNKSTNIAKKEATQLLIWKEDENDESQNTLQLPAA